jgi:aminoglycoside 2''-phosphotransferase
VVWTRTLLSGVPHIVDVEGGARVKVPARYLAKIRATYPDLALDHVQLNSDGMVNDVIVVNRALVCRFVRNQRDNGQLIGEAAILKVVNDLVDLPTPRLDHLDAGFASYPYIPGEPLSRSAIAKLSASGRSQVLDQLAVFHRQLHDISTDALAAANVPASPTQRTRADWLDLYARVQHLLFSHLWAHQRTWVEELFEPILLGQLDLTYSPTLIHGDLAIYHVFHDPDRETLTGVIDFGVAGLGDPACDIAIQLINYGDHVVQRMTDDNPDWLPIIDRARFLAATLELQWATTGIEQNDASLLLAHIGGNREIEPVTAT